MKIYVITLSACRPAAQTYHAYTFCLLADNDGEASAKATAKARERFSAGEGYENISAITKLLPAEFLANDDRVVGIQEKL